eukprot:scaffold26571_cov52-Attheya_sp.AAC.2
MKSSSATTRSSDLVPMLTKVGSPRMAWFRGVNNDFAEGKMVAAWCSFPTIDRKRFSGTRRFFRMERNSRIMGSAFDFGSLIVRR